MIGYYGATSEVAWLFLLAYWIAALVLAACGYAVWNWWGLRARLHVVASEPGPDSPMDELPELLVRNGPFPAPVFEGDRFEIEIGLESSGGPRGPARFAGSIGDEELSAATGLVPRAGWTQRRLIGPAVRGPVSSRAWVLESGDPLGFFRWRRRKPDAEVTLVLPRFTSLLAQPDVRELEASIAAPRAGSGTELFGVREYRPGDPLRRIHWRSSARRGELVVREFEPPGVQTLGIYCDPQPATREVADQVARLAASEAWDCLRAGGRVLLWAPGQEPSAPSDARSLWALLEWLARYPSATAAGRLEPPTTPISDAVAVMGSGNDHIVEALESVRRRGGRIRAWVVGDAELDRLDMGGAVKRVGTSWPL